MIIYKATNLVNGKVYIGLTIQAFDKRKSQHIHDAFNSKTNMIFHKALRKYGEDNFLWEVIDNAETEEELKDKEIYYISLYNSHINTDNSHGYNMTLGGEGMGGLLFTDERNQKISDSQTGSNNSSAKLTEEDVLQIKELIKTGLSPIVIANEFNIDHATVSAIKTGRIWKHIGENLSHIEYSKIKYSKLTEEDILEIKSLIKEGKLTQTEIANQFNVKSNTICNIKRGKKWSHIGEDVKGRGQLDEKEVIEIKQLLKDGNLSQNKIAKMFNVSQMTICNINKGKSWVCIGDDISSINHNRTGSSKLTEEDVIEIKRLLKEGSLSQNEIANKFNVQQVAISKIKLGKTWKHIESA